MSNFKITEFYDKFTQIKTITIKDSFGYSASFISSPSGEEIKGLLHDYYGTYLLDGVDRLEADYDDSCTLRELERICEAKTIESQNGNKCADLRVIPMARALYNAAIEQKYSVDEIDPMYKRYVANYIGNSLKENAGAILGLLVTVAFFTWVIIGAFFSD